MTSPTEAPYRVCPNPNNCTADCGNFDELTALRLQRHRLLARLTKAAAPAAQTSEPRTADEIERAIVPHGSNGECSNPDLCVALTDFRLAIEAEARRLTVERRIDLTEIAAAMLRGEQACERGHRAGEINAHVHFDQLQRWARRLAALAREEAEA